MYQGNIGDNSVQCANTVVLSVQQGASVNVANSSNSTGTLNYQSTGLENAFNGTIATGANQTFTTQTWLTNTGGISSVTIVGTGY